MKTMKLGAKIGLGFGVFILLGLVSGIAAVWNVVAIEGTAQRVAKGYLPQVKLASDLERHFMQATLGTTIYASTQDGRYLALGKKALAEARKNLDDGVKLAASSPDLARFRAETEQAREKINQYEKQLNQAALADYELKRSYDEMNETNKFFMSNAASFLSGQLETLKAELQRRGSPGKLQERLTKVALTNELIDLGNQVHAAVSTALAQRDLKAITAVDELFAGTDKKLDALQAVTRSDANLALLSNLRAASGMYRDSLTSFTGSWSAVQKLNTQGEETGKEIIALTQGAHDAGLDDTGRVSEKTVTKVSFSTLLMMVGALFATILGSVTAVVITRSATKPVRKVASGLSDGAELVTSASSHLTTSSEAVADGASRQAAAIEESAASLEQISAMTRNNAENASQADRLMQETSKLVSHAAGSMDQLTTSMAEITRASEDTRKIVKTIDEVAFQTNLLALNAAVEAARAGEAGAGFAVVAEEVRKLAKRTAEAAQSTAGLIEQTTLQVGEGAAIVVKTAGEFAEVARSVTSCGELVGEITAASREQAKGIDEVSAAVQEMDRIVQQNAAIAEESASASRELSTQAEEMKGFVGELVALVGTGEGKRRARSGCRPALLPDAGGDDDQADDACAEMEPQLLAGSSRVS